MDTKSDPTTLDNLRAVHGVYEEATAEVDDQIKAAQKDVISRMRELSVRAESDAVYTEEISAAIAVAENSVKFSENTSKKLHSALSQLHTILDQYPRDQNAEDSQIDQLKQDLEATTARYIMEEKMRKEELQTAQTLLESEKRKVQSITEELSRVKAVTQADGDKCKVEFEKEVMKLKAQRSEDSVKITDLEAKIRELASDKERLEETAQVTMQEISERLASTTDLSETLRSEKAQLEKKFTELSTSSQVLESSLPKLKSQRDELTDQVAKMTVIIDELKSELKIAADAPPY